MIIDRIYGKRRSHRKTKVSWNQTLAEIIEWLDPVEVSVNTIQVYDDLTDDWIQISEFNNRTKNLYNLYYHVEEWVNTIEEADGSEPTAKRVRRDESEEETEMYDLVDEESGEDRVEQKSPLSRSNWLRKLKTYVAWRKQINTPHLTTAVVASRMRGMFSREDASYNLTEEAARTVINTLYNDGMGWTALGRIMHSPIGPKSLKEWTRPCVSCEKRAARIRQRCTKKCVLYCLPCFESHMPRICHVCEVDNDVKNHRNCRTNAIGDNAFKNITANVVFSLQRIRNGHNFDKTFNDSFRIIEDEDSDMDLESVHSSTPIS